MNISVNDSAKMECTSFSLVTDKFPFGMMLVSADGKILAVNRAASQLLKSKASELLDQNLSLLTDASPSQVKEKLKSCVRSRTPCPVPIALHNQNCVISEGFLFMPAAENKPAQIVLRVEAYHAAKNQFFILNEKVEQQKKVMRRLRQSETQLQKELELRIQTENEVLLLNYQLEEKVKTRTRELESSLSELKQAQKTLIQTEKMSSLGRLVAGVAHEINTPIGNCLLGMSYIQEQAHEAAQKLNSKTLSENYLRSFLKDLYTMSDSMLTSLNNTADLVSSFKEIAVDQHSEKKRTFNLHKYCGSVLLNFKGRLKNLPIDVINSIDDTITIHSYPGVFSQIISNLVMNAVLHGIKAEGKIELSASYDSEHLIFTCADNGIGIKEELIDKIFDPFFSTSLGQGGSGLGLSIISNLVTHKLHGEITCVSETDKGTKMIIRIPKNNLLNLSQQDAFPQQN